MKKNILIAILFTFIGIVTVQNVSAQSAETRWNGNDVATMYQNKTTTKVYLYNVKYGKFVINGSNWGTRAVLKFQDYGISMTVNERGGNRLSGYRYCLKTTFQNSGDANSVYLSYASSTDSRSQGFFVDQLKANGWFVFNRVETDASAETYTYKLKLYGGSGSGKWLSSDGSLTTYPTTEPGEEGEWRLVTQEQLNAVLEAKAAENYSGLNGDATYLIKGQNFARNDNDAVGAWTLSGSGAVNYRYNWRNNSTTNDRWNKLVLTAEGGTTATAIENGGYYNGTLEGTGTCSQKITLPVTGMYKLQCQGFYANSNDAASLLYVKVGDVVTSASLHDASATYPISTYNGYENRNVDLGLSAGKAFDAGTYPVELYFRGEAGTQIELGFNKQHSTQSTVDYTLGKTSYYHDTDYTAFDNLQLKYFGEEPFILDESETEPSYLANVNLENTTVLLKRSFTLNEWNSLVLPVNMTSAQVKQAFGEGTELGRLQGLNEDNPNIIMFESVALPADGNAINAGELYIIKPHLAAAGESITIEGVVYEGPFYTLGRRDVNSIPEIQPIVCYRPEGSSHPNDIKAMGTYIKLNGGCPAGSYVFSRGDIYHTQSDLTIKGFRGWIIDVDLIDTGAKDFTFCLDGVEDSNIATALQNVESVGKQSVRTIYNLNGQKIPGNTSLESLPKGIFIVNGKKLMVK